MPPTKVQTAQDSLSTWRSRLTSLITLAAVNIAVLLASLVVVELFFGTWIRPMGLNDLKRFSIPIGVSFESDVSSLYSGGPRNPITYSRDEWGLRGTYRSLVDIDILTVGGSTTEQRYLDDLATWQQVAQRELHKKGHPFVIANAGVDGQSTVGHTFDFDYWFPLVPDLRPRVVLFYVGANDVLRHEQRDAFDSSMDAKAWRFQSATYQLYRTIRSNKRARNVRVGHSRMRPPSQSDFTEHGLLSSEQRESAAGQITGSFLSNVEGLRQRVSAVGAVPIFMTQTAFGWKPDPASPLGLKQTVKIQGLTVNFADVGFLHQHLNRGLLAYCTKHGITCFDLASDVSFDPHDYYDYLHNTPRGAEKIGRYLADRLAELDLASDERH